MQLLNSPRGAARSLAWGLDAHTARPLSAAVRAAEHGADARGPRAAAPGSPVPECRFTPEILKAVLSGTLPPRITLKNLHAAARELDWSKQAAILGID